MMMAAHNHTDSPEPPAELLCFVIHGCGPITTPAIQEVKESLARFGYAHTEAGALSVAEIAAAGLLDGGCALPRHCGRPGCMEGVTEMKPKPGDVVIVSDRHAQRIGTVLSEFTSATGESIYDVQLAGNHRVAALAGDIVINLGPHSSEETSLRIGRWPRDE